MGNVNNSVIKRKKKNGKTVNNLNFKVSYFNSYYMDINVETLRNGPIQQQQQQQKNYNITRHQQQ